MSDFSKKTILITAPTNWDSDLIKKIEKRSLVEFYGKLSQDIVGGGRPTSILSSIRKKDISRHVLEVHAYGIKFNYLLNATCLDNVEFTSKGYKKIRAMLDWLEDLKVDALTVASPYLLDIIKKNYSFEVNVSVQAGVDNPAQAIYWEDLGADQITLLLDVNRDFARIRKIRKNLKCRLQLIANLKCLHNCPFYFYHANLNSHASQSGHRLKGFFMDYCFLKCSALKLAQPWQLIRSGWIRPEDLDIYAEMGIDRIKLVDRGMTTDNILKIVRAYSEKKYSGNLFDLFPDPVKNMNYKAKNPFKMLKYYFHPDKVNIFKLYKLVKEFKNVSFLLDNSKLDGFLKFFLDEKCKIDDCKNCSYCKDIAAKFLNFDSTDNEDALKGYNKFLTQLTKGDIFK